MKGDWWRLRRGLVEVERRLVEVDGRQVEAET